MMGGHGKTKEALRKYGKALTQRCNVVQPLPPCQCWCYLCKGTAPDRMSDGRLATVSDIKHADDCLITLYQELEQE